MTTHPLIESAIKAKLVKKVQDAVLSKWVNDASRMDRRTLALIYLSHAADVLENAFAPLSDEDYELAMKRVRELLDLDFENEWLNGAIKEEKKLVTTCFQRSFISPPNLTVETAVVVQC